MKILGHRGFGPTKITPKHPYTRDNTPPENTLCAFDHVLLAGADGIELDVLLTRDLEMVIAHDDRLDSGELISELNCADLQTNPRYRLEQDETIPTLQAVLALVSDHQKRRPEHEKILINLDIKSEHPSMPNILSDLLFKIFQEQPHQAAILDPTQFLISAYSDELLLNIRQRIPTIRLGLCIRSHEAENWETLKKWIEWISEQGIDAIDLNALYIKPELLRLCYDYGLFIMTCIYPIQAFHPIEQYEYEQQEFKKIFLTQYYYSKNHEAKNIEILFKSDEPQLTQLYQRMLEAESSRLHWPDYSRKSCPFVDQKMC